MNRVKVGSQRIALRRNKFTKIQTEKIERMAGSCAHHQLGIISDTDADLFNHFKVVRTTTDGDACSALKVKVAVCVHCYVDGTLGVFHGPRKLAGYDAQGNLPLQELKQAA